ncbi:MFS transporter [Dehalobacter sp. DCM]|uniref:MFS transporter n=1 Tax=Dehalobacter sp. DCM TaxID=2907827 RepID=UPI003081A67B|nr:MFS transporter [Dehalobacter sp. DCM]
MEMSKKPIAASVSFGIFMLYLLNSGNGAATGALFSMSQIFPDVPFSTISMINTLPSITLIIGSILMSSILGKKISFKTAGIVSFLVFGIFGILPTFIHGTFYQILIARVLYGFGAGLLAPIGAAAYLRYIRDYETRSKYLGFGKAADLFGCFMLTLLGGWLAAIHWSYTFLAYLVAFVALVLFLLTFKEPPTMDELLKAEGKTDASEFESAKRVKLAPRLWAIVVLSVFIGMVTGPFMMNFSSIIGSKINAGPGVAGTLLSIFVLAGVVSTVITGPLVKMFKQFSFLAGMVVAMIGCLIVANAMSVAMFTVGILIFGLGYLAVLPIIVLESSTLTNTAGLAWAASLFWIGMNVGNFLCSYWDGFMLKMVNGDWGGTYYITGAAVVIIGIAWTAIIWGSPKWKKTNSETAAK